jgi:ribosomal protein S18 acetylase RimI-like enzyme
MTTTDEGISSNDLLLEHNIDAKIQSKNVFESCFSLIGKTSFFKRRENNKSERLENGQNKIEVSIYSINISKILESSNTSRKSIKKKFQLKRFNDLIHTICALYDNVLPDIGPNSVYECISATKSYTIMIIKNDVNAEENNDDTDGDKESLYNETDCLSQLEEENPEPDSLFKNVFSDSDEEEDDDDDDDDEDDEKANADVTQGLKSFLAKNIKTQEKDPITKNLVACATLQRCIAFPLPGHEEWVIDLQLMGVRKKYRGFNIGKYLVSLVQNRNYVKKYDAIVTSSDLDAILFYEKYGFSKDPILNSKYSGIGDIWTNTTKMCYIPPYASLTDGNDAQDENSFISELAHMEKDFKRWQKASFGAYQSQTAIFNKLKQEIFTLKAKLCAKDGIIDDLSIKNDILVKKNRALSLRIQNYEIDEIKHDNDEFK